MGWHWRYERSDGTTVTPDVGAPDSFPSQADAESWLGESWRDLVDAQVDQVWLLEDDREVYGPMSLHAPE
jgi:hypothetical protein